MAKTIIIVDDMPQNRMILKNGLSGEYGILEADNGETALALIRQNQHTLSAVLLDIFMPIMDGFEVLRTIRTDPLLAQLPVIIITSSENDSTRETALKLGANDFVTKPYSISLIKHCLRNNIALREAASMANLYQLDKLTGIFTREILFEKVNALLKTGKPDDYIFVCYDIDNFKLVNDQYGAAEGDRILKHMACAMQAAFSHAGGICGRITGDNFAGLYPNNPQTIEYMTQSRKSNFLPEEIHSSLQISEGCYRIADCSLPASAIYDRAFIAKQSIKGRYDQHAAGFNSSMLETLIGKQQIISDMDAAIARREFEIWFQPQYNHASGALVGAEALVRWQHPQRGMIYPSEFIPIFEQNGFIYELDKYVWEEVCRRLQQWLKDSREPLPVSVNVSRYDIFREDLVDFLTELIAKYRIPVELLRLEITESAFAKSTEQIIPVVCRLLAKGFIIEIDDFGSGYSSLNTLKDVPAQVVKLDMHFLESTENTPRGGNILKSVVRMAKWLGMSVIAEGVETVEQANFLKSVGCPYVQGYLYARPMPAEDYRSLTLDALKEQRLFSLQTIENLNSNTFWDPASMDTLIFNSYVGGAGVAEYEDGKLELLRANDKFIRVIGSADLTLEAALKLDWAKHLSLEEQQVLSQSVNTSLQSKSEVTQEFIFNDLPGCPHETYLLITLRVIASVGNCHLLYCTNENVTALRQSQGKEREAEKQRLATSERLQAILDHINCGITVITFVDGQEKPIFANDRFYEMLGRVGCSDELFTTHVPIHPDDREAVAKVLKDCFEQKHEHTVEYRVLRPDGTQVRLRTTSTAADFISFQTRVILSVHTDITAECETESQLRFLNDMARELLAQPDIQQGIEGVLRSLLSYFDGNRAYVFELDFANELASNTYEVCAPGVSHELDNLQNLPISVFPFWLHAFDEKDYLYIPDVNALDDSREEEKQTLLAQGIQSLIAVPLKRDGKTFGFIGIDDSRRQQEQVGRLAALGDFVAVMLTRRDLTSKIKSDDEIMTNLMNDTPGGFVRMQVLPGGGVIPLYFNEGFCKLVDMTLDELLQLYGSSSFAGVHPDDVSIVQESVAELLRCGEVTSAKYRLRYNHSGYVWVVFRGRVTHSDGKTYLNIYYTDASELNKSEQLQRELLDNLPCGAAIYRLSGEELSVSYRNRQYRTILGWVPDEQSPVFNSIHPDDRPNVRAAFYLALANHEDFLSCEARLKDSTGGYSPFRLAVNIVPRQDGSITLYVTFTGIAMEKLSYREIMPLVLSAIMECSNDLTFAKDNALRYICGSRAFAKMVGLESERELRGKTDYDLFGKEMADKFRHDDETLLASGSSIVDMVEQIPSADGIPHYSSTSKYLLRDTQGNIIGLYGIGRDITAYRDASDKLTLVNNSIPGGIATFVCTGSTLALQHLRISYFNDGVCRLLGMSREECLKLSQEDPVRIVNKDDLPMLSARFRDLYEKKLPLECTCRIHTREGIKWVTLKAVAADQEGNALIVHILILDVTEQQQAIEKLQLSDEANRLATLHSGSTVCRLSIADRVLTLPAEAAAKLSLPESIADMPNGILRLGRIAPESEAAFTAFYESIFRGEKSGTFLCQSLIGDSRRWFDIRYSTVFSRNNEPAFAVITFLDITEQLEKETVYKKWQQSLQERPEDSYTLLRVNLTKDTAFDAQDGSLLPFDFGTQGDSFNERSQCYARKLIVKEDRDCYTALVNSDALLAAYYRGKRSETLEYRELLPDGEHRWLRLSVDLVECSNSTEIEAYLMYEDIDADKREELQIKKRAQTDSLTGVLNRKAFSEKLETLVKSMDSERLCALMLLDLDCFKLINDHFGHATGDETLIEIGQSLSTVLRSHDLIGRLGGDEFLIFLSNIPDRTVISKKARQICALLRKSFSREVQLSVSIGIAVCPEDGADFEQLYHKADCALYYVKADGKNNFAFYRDSMADVQPSAAAAVKPLLMHTHKSPMRRMLVVEDNTVNRNLLVGMFRDEFIIDTADDGNAALRHLKTYGAAISVVLLDLMMPHVDGFEVLQRMQTLPELQTIPVIVVSGMNERENSLKAISYGACDYICKPIDEELLRLRVMSALSRAENEKLRAQNRYLNLLNSDVERLRSVLEVEGTVLVEYDSLAKYCSYDASITKYLAGHYDERLLWDILLQDGVAEPAAALLLQEQVMQFLADDANLHEHLLMQLKTPSGASQRFRLILIRRPAKATLLISITPLADPMPN